MLAIYPAHFKSYTTRDIDNLINGWATLLEGYSYTEAEAGLRVCLASDKKGFPPTPGQVIDCILKIIKPESEQLSDGAAWTLVMRAVEKGIWYADEEFNKLPEPVQRVLHDPSALRRMAEDDDFNEGVAGSNFRKTYRAMMERDREEAKFAPAVKALVGRTANQITAKE